MKVYFLLFLMVFTILILNMLYIIQVPYTKNYYITTFSAMCTAFSSPMEVARHIIESPFTSEVKDFFPSDCDAEKPPPYMGKWELLHRPITGDHIHILIKTTLDNIPIIFHDRNLTQIIPYETPPTSSCRSEVPYAYKKSFYHTGVHTHCDSSSTNGGIIHIHPWSSPIQLRVEGRQVTLQMFFESVGIEHSTKKLGFLINGKYYKLNLEYYIDATNPFPSFTTNNEEEIKQLWLPDCHGALLLWDEASEKPEITREDIEFLKGKKCYPDNYPSRAN